MPQPKIPNSLRKMAAKLFASAAESEAFIQCFENFSSAESSLVWLKEPQVLTEPLPALEFQPSWVQRVQDFSAGSHPLHSEGAFYIMDSSSVFAASPLLELDSTDLIFDACASPGGKSIFAWRALAPKHLIANEFVEKRLKPLISNFQRCHIKPSEVFHLPTKRIGEMFPATFPLVLVDAPCSGQSLLLKGDRVDGAFHPQTINGNAMRQRRILAELAPSVAPDGHLLYMTCTFSKEENEEIVDWFSKKFPQFQTQPLSRLANYQSHLSESHCYRLWPQSGKGSGSFTALFKNKEAGDRRPLIKDYKPVWQNN